MAEENKHRAAEENRAAGLRARSIEERDEPCLLCLEKFSEPASISRERRPPSAASPPYSENFLEMCCQHPSTASFNVKCSCPRNDRMVHFYCFAAFPLWDRKCGICSSPLDIVDILGRSVVGCLVSTPPSEQIFRLNFGDAWAFWKGAKRICAYAEAKYLEARENLRQAEEELHRAEEESDC